MKVTLWLSAFDKYVRLNRTSMISGRWLKHDSVCKSIHMQTLVREGCNPVLYSVDSLWVGVGWQRTVPLAVAPFDIPIRTLITRAPQR